jgi:2-aminoadipate transaminase
MIPAAAYTEYLMMSEAIWDERLSNGARNIVSSAIRDLLRFTEQPEVISFAGGLPAAELFPAEHIAAAVKTVLVNNPVAALQYGPTEGYRPLRGWLQDRMAHLGMSVPTEDIMLTSGSQQGLDLVGKLLIDQDASVVVEDPTYLGALQAWRPYQPRFIALPTDDEGLHIDALERLLRSGERPRFLYVVSSFQNPTGTTLGPARRQALVEVAGRYGLPIVEDDPYGELVYEGERAQTLAAIDIALHGSLQHVIYLSTFSKLLAPGLRVGWMVGPTALMPRFVHAKQGLDLHTGSLGQAAIFETCKDGLLDEHIPLLCRTYGARRNTMLGALDEYMPSSITWSRPRGGMFLWLTLPHGANTTTLLAQALENHVAFVPGTAFFANGGGAHTMRLNFSHAGPERIVEGVRRLAQTMATM